VKGYRRLMRCFVAIELDQPIKQALLEAQRLFQDLPGRVNWVKPEQMHLTVKFLGDVPDQQVPDVAKVLQRCAGAAGPFQFRVGRLGCFPERGPIRVLWAGVQAPQPLFDIQQACETALAELGFDPEQRRYSPHLTLGRVRFVKNSNVYRQVIEENTAFEAGVQTADRIVLLSSRLLRTGAVYTPVATLPLAGGR